MSVLRRSLLAFAVAAFFVGCGEQESAAADVAPGGETRSAASDVANAGAGGSAASDIFAFGGACPPPPVEAGIARVRPLGCAADLPTGPLIAGRIGDVVLENAVARFVVRVGAEGRAVVGIKGGNVVDAVRIGPDGAQLGHDSLREWVPMVAMHLLEPESYELTPDGPDARLLVRGRLRPFAVLHASLPLEHPPVQVANEYRLAPDRTTLQIRTFVVPNPGQKGEVLVGDATFWGGAMGLFRAGIGDTETGAPAKYPVAVLGLTRLRADPNLLPAAFGFAAPLSTVDAGGHLAFVHPPKAIPPSGAVFTRLLALGPGDNPSLADAMAAAGTLADTTAETIRGQVVGMFHGVEVELYDADGRPLTRCTPDADGDFACSAPLATRSLRARWIGNGEGQTGGGGQEGPLLVFDGPPASELEVEAPVPARIHIFARDPADQPVACQAQLIPGANVAYAGKRVFVDANCDAIFLVPPGTWTVWLHHGPEWSAHQQKVIAKPGQTAHVQATLAPVIDTVGWVAADTHIHAEHSSDSDVPNEERILDAVAAGVDYAVATDHDFVTDYQPFLAATGLQGRITVASGVEVSTAKFGHHGVWPMPHDPERAGGGPPEWYGKSAATLMATIRGNDPARIHQLNHARGIQSYFGAIGLVPSKTPAHLLTFDAIELLNSKRMEDVEQVLGDWLGLLAAGHRFPVTGTSDTHTLLYGAGSGRSYVWLGVGPGGIPRDAQGAFTGAQVDAAIRAGRTVASSGPHLRPTLRGAVAVAGVGETLRGAVGEVRFRVVVQAPAWMPLGTLQLLRNGSVVRSQALTEVEAIGGARRVAVEVTAPEAKKPGWWVAVLRPDPAAPRPPIQEQPVWAVSSPIYEAP